MNDCCNRPGQEGFDVAVIGAGSAGFSAAIAAADLGDGIEIANTGDAATEVMVTTSGYPTEPPEPRAPADVGDLLVRR